MQTSRWLVSFTLFTLLLPASAGAITVPFRRWVADKTATCSTASDHVSVSIDNQNIEFADLPADAQFTINYVENGVTTTNGPYTVEQTSGTKAYGSFSDNFPSYPFTFDFRVDTLINGFVVYRSSLILGCTGDGSFTPTITNVDGRTPGLFTGSWVGKWSCKASDNGAKTTPGNKTSTLDIEQGDDVIAARLDGGPVFRGVEHADAKKPDAVARAILVDCRSTAGGTTPTFNQTIDATLVTKGMKAKLSGVGPLFSDDGTHRIIGTCKYKYKRSATDDPGDITCPLL